MTQGERFSKDEVRGRLSTPSRPCHVPAAGVGARERPGEAVRGRLTFAASACASFPAVAVSPLQPAGSSSSKVAACHAQGTDQASSPSKASRGARTEQPFPPPRLGQPLSPSYPPYPTLGRGHARPPHGGH